eukprot:scaffold11928_cov111-Isochrysis_galbana.AAC.2
MSSEIISFASFACCGSAAGARSVGAEGQRTACTRASAECGPSGIGAKDTTKIDNASSGIRWLLRKSDSHGRRARCRGRGDGHGRKPQQGFVHMKKI